MQGRIGRMRGAQWLLLLLSALFAWPAIVNGGAFYFPDTTAYIRGPDAALHRATGWRSAWTDDTRLPQGAAATPTPAPTATAAAKGEAGGGRPVLLGRSIFYGVVVFAGAALGADWLTVLVQALVAGAAVIALVRHAVDPSRGRAFALACAGCFGVLALTPLPFFVSMLMPDFMAAIGILAAAMLVAGWRRETPAGRLLWLALAAAAALVHSANVLILLGLALPAFVIGAILRAPATRRGALMTAACALIGLAGELAFGWGIAATTGQPPIRPPFLTARLVEDGPGTAYLRRACPAAGFVLCDYRSRLPLGSDAFLWSPQPRTGVFMTLSPADQRRLSAEQAGFVATVATSLPGETALAMAHAIGRQIAALGLVEFNYTPEQNAHVAGRLPAGVQSDVERTRAYRRTMPVDLVEWLLWPSVIVSLALVALAWRRPDTRDLALYASIVVAGWLLNDAICGAFSTPHERYQARVIWMLPLMAALIVARRRAARPAA